MFKKFIALLTAVVLCTLTVPALAGRTSSAACEAAIHGMTKADLDVNINGRGALPRVAIETACTSATGDLLQLKAGLVYELLAVEKMRREEPTPVAVARVLKLLTTSEELFSTCGGEYAKPCGLLKGGVAKLAADIREARAAPPPDSQAT